MSTTIGALKGWTEIPGSPTISGESNNDTLTASYCVPASALSGRPAYNSAYPGRLASMYSTLKLNSYKVDPTSDKDIYKVSLVYRSPETVIYTTHSDGDEEISMSSEPFEKDISSHPNYKAIWNHSLTYAPNRIAWPEIYNTEDGEGNDDPAEDAPDGWATAKSPIIEGKSWWQFIRLGDAVPQGWIVYAKPTKKAGLQGYVMPNPVVQSKKYYTTYAKAIAAASASDVGDWATPSKTFGRSGDWLVMGVHIAKDGKYWTVGTQYQNTNVKDTDIYPVPLDTSGGNA